MRLKVEVKCPSVRRVKVNVDFGLTYESGSGLLTCDDDCILMPMSMSNHSKLMIVQSPKNDYYTLLYKTTLLLFTIEKKNSLCYLL